jgi:aminoglycoside 3-N-acetyltransferase
MAAVAQADIERGLRELGVDDACCIVHSSLSSYGRVDGGADAVVDALCGVVATVVVPTFTFSPALAAPADDRPARNGADYAIDPLGSMTPELYTTDLPVAKPIGIVPETLRRRPGAERSGHPLVSFAAWGQEAAKYVEPHDWDAPHAPLERLLADGGTVLMLGTDLTSCTTIHLGEQLAGRRPFVRWVRAADGQAQRVRVGGCSAGFERLRPHLAGVREVMVGAARVQAVPLAAVVEATQRLLADDPDALICPDRCRRCVDAARGGPCV